MNTLHACIVRKSHFMGWAKGTRAQRQGETRRPELLLLCSLINYSIITLECEAEIIHLDSFPKIFKMSLLILSEVVLHINTNSRVAEWLNFIPVPNSGQIFIISFTILEQLEILQGHKSKWLADNGLIQVVVLVPTAGFILDSCYNLLFERKK